MKGLLLMLMAWLPAIGVCADAGESTLTSILKDFDRANATEQSAIAGRFFDVLNNEEFFDEPYSMPKGWPADSVRAEVWLYAGQYFFYTQDYTAGIEYTRKALPLLRGGGDTDKLADCISHLSSCYFRISDYANAINYAKEVLDIDRKLGDKITISSDMSNIAAIFLASKRPDEALPFALDAIRNSTAAGDSTRMAIQMGIASEIYHSLCDYNKAVAYAMQAYDLDERRGRTAKAAIRLCQMAPPLIALKKYDEAEACLLKALPVLEEAGNRQSYSIACNQLGTIALGRGNPATAISYFMKALPFFAGRGDIYNESTTREGLYRALKQTDPATAMTHLERYVALRDSIYHHDMQEAISEHNARYRNDELQLKYEYEEKLRGISTWIILLAVGVIILLLYVNRQRKQKHDLIKQAEQMRTNFFTNITHEFRTPLTVIQSAAQEMMDSSPAESSTHSHAANILHHEQGLLKLINQILDVAKMASAEVRADAWKHGDIAGFVSTLCESLRTYAASRSIELECVVPSQPVEMDFIPDYTQKIVQNLISNAIKFSFPGGKVCVGINRKGQAVQISVSDRGIGMTSQQKQNIFKPFYQASDDTGNIGTGIGLSVVKLAVEHMDGQIEVTSSPEDGSTFVVTLPVRKGADVAIVQNVADIVKPAECDLPEPANLPVLDDDDCADSDAIRILIVEDSPDVALYIGRQLKDEYHCYFAADGNEGLRKAEELVPDLIVTDIMMPGLDGFELCRRVRSSELLDHIPVVMVTARATHADRMRGLEAGADAYIEKPFRADELNIRVEKLIEQRRLLRLKYSGADEATHGSDTAGPALSDINTKFLAKLAEAVAEAIDRGKIDYDALAYSLCMSRAQLNRKVKAITGFTTTDYILQVRVSIAKKLLDTTDAASWEVARSCGMENYSYFCTIFKKSTGMTPLQYKNRQQ